MSLSLTKLDLAYMSIPKASVCMEVSSKGNKACSVAQSLLVMRDPITSSREIPQKNDQSALSQGA